MEGTKRAAYVECEEELPVLGDFAAAAGRHNERPAHLDPRAALLRVAAAAENEAEPHTQLSIGGALRKVTRGETRAVWRIRQAIFG
jgi:hypothetical protein